MEEATNEIEELTSKALKNDPDALFELGECYYYGNKVKKDVGLALIWYKRAARLGHQNAQAIIDEEICTSADKGDKYLQSSAAVLYFLGRNVKQNFTKAFNIFSSNPNQKEGERILYLSICYKCGLGTKQSIKRGDSLLSDKEAAQLYDDEIIRVLEQQSEKGNSYATYLLGTYYEYNVKASNPTTAFKCFKNSAEQNISKAKYCLAQHYFYGTGTDQNYKKAFELYRNLADKSDANSQFKLAECYYHGLGTDQNYLKAFELYTLLNEKSDIVTKYELAECYYYGRGTTLDFIKAFELYRYAYRKGNTKADSKLALSYFYGIGTTVDYKKAYYYNNDVNSIHDVGQNLEWLNNACNHGIVGPQMKIAECYFYGIGVSQDFSKAYRYYELSSKLNIKYAACFLSLCNWIGIGTKPRNKETGLCFDLSDVEHIREWLLFASSKGFSRAQSLTAEYAMNHTNEFQENEFEDLMNCLIAVANTGDSDVQSFLANCYCNGTFTEQDYDKAFHWYNISAKNGNADSQCELGYMYLVGNGSDIDYAQSYKWFKSAADSGNSKAQYYLGVIYANGYGVKKDKIEAFKWYSLASDNGDDKAKFELINCYYTGNCVKKDFDKVFELLSQLDSTGNLSGTYHLANCYYFGIGTAQDPQGAFDLYTKAAEAGIQEAQYYLSLCYKYGIGTRRTLWISDDWFSESGMNHDMVRDFIWIKQAADFGSKHAQLEIAQDYYFGIGAKQDFEKAFEWYFRASENRNREAKCYLSLCYRIGLGTIRNDAEAIRISNDTDVKLDVSDKIEWLRNAAKAGNIRAKYLFGKHLIKSSKEEEKADGIRYIIEAAKAGDPDAQQVLANCYYNGTQTEQDYKKAFYWYGLSAQNGNPISQCNLGYMYFVGYCSDIDYAQSYKWFKLAADSGNSKAQYYLGIIYANGYGVEKNLEEAFSLFESSSNGNNTEAQYELAKSYYFGLGTKQDLSAAISYFTLAANKGSQDAQYYLSLCDFFGLVNANAYYNLDDNILRDRTKDFKFDPIQDFQKIKQAAELGSKYAQFTIAQNYFLGLGMEHDFIQAFEWYKKAAENGNKTATYYLSLCYSTGIGTERDEVEAKRLLDTCDNKLSTLEVRTWLRTAEESGNIRAQYLLGKSLINSFKYEKRSEGIIFLTKAAEANNSDAQHDLAECYFNGMSKVVDQDYSKANYWYGISAENGNSDSQFKLGYIYYSGLGVDIDYVRSAKLFEISALQGHTQAQIYLGLQYYSGLGLKQDSKKAFEWYMLAASQEDPWAEYCLAEWYFNVQNFSMAYYWYNKAALDNYQLAEFFLSLCYKIGLGTEQNSYLAKTWFENSKYETFIPETFEWLKVALKSNLPIVKFMIADCYYYGIGTSQDFELAFKYYLEAAQTGACIRAEFYTALCYDFGIGTKPNAKQAKYWHQLAREYYHTINSGRLSWYKVAGESGISKAENIYNTLLEKRKQQEKNFQQCLYNYAENRYFVRIQWETNDGYFPTDFSCFDD